MDWSTAVAIAGIFLGGGGIATVALGHLLKVRRTVRDEAVGLYANGILDGVARALRGAFDEARLDRHTRLDLEGHLREALQSRLADVPGLEKLAGLPDGFHRLPLLCFALLERYAACRLGIRDRRRRGEDPSPLALCMQEIEGAVEALLGILNEASLRIRCLGAWSHRGMAERLRADKTLAALGTRVLDLEESLESLEYGETEAPAGPEGSPAGQPGGGAGEPPQPGTSPSSGS